MNELKEEVDNSIIIVGDISTPLSIMNKTTWREINKEIKVLTTPSTKKT